MHLGWVLAHLSSTTLFKIASQGLAKIILQIRLNNPFFAAFLKYYYCIRQSW